METQSCIVRPKEDGQFEVRSATQWMDKVQQTVSGVLGIPDNKIDVSVSFIVDFDFARSMIIPQTGEKNRWRVRRQDLQAQLRGCGLCRGCQQAEEASETGPGLGDQHGVDGSAVSVPLPIHRDLLR